MASGEVTLDDAYALPVGELANGFRQMAEMVNVSRLSNAMRAAALMRRAVLESVEHTRGRIVFGTPLFDQPLMRATLLPMILDAEAALGLVLEAASQLDRADSGDEAARKLVRILTPLAKYTVCKQARRVTGEAMEIRGGNGYIEDWVNPRLLRDAHLGSIWEGSSNVIALDVLRCMRREAAHRTVAEEYLARAKKARMPEAEGAVAWLARQWRALLAEGDDLLREPDEEQQVQVAAFASTMARTVMATLLAEQAAYETARGDGYRKLLVATSYLQRLAAPGTIPRAALAHLAELADGGHISASAAEAVPTGEPAPA